MQRPSVIRALQSGASQQLAVPSPVSPTAVLRNVQAQFNANKTLPAWINETEWFWIAQRHQFMMVQYTR